MRTLMKGRALVALALLALLALGACDDATVPREAREAPVQVSGVLTPEQQAIVAGMSVEVTGPGIGTAIIADLTVNGAQVNGTVTVPVGSSRTFTVRAYDGGGIETHVGSATASVSAGTNPPLAVRLAATTGSVPIDVTIATYGVTLTPATASVAVDGEVTLTAGVTASNGTTPAGALTWGIVNPALVTLTVAADGRTATVRGRIAGSTRVVASYEGVAAATTVTITAAAGNQPPTARANGPYTTRWPSTSISFSSAGSTDADGTIASYLWTFGDGTTSTSANPVKAYATTGTYDVTLTVTDDDGATATSGTTATVRPENQWPTASINPSYRTTVGVPVTLQAAGFDADGSVTGFSWSYGSNACTPGTPSSSGTLTCTFAATGQYAIAVAAIDNEGMTGRSATTVVTVDGVGTPPTGSFAATQLSAGGSFTCALVSGGAAYCWGGNSFGQLGDGTTTERTAPVRVKMPAGVTFTSLRSGLFHSCANASDGNTYCWGGNAHGQLGLGDTQPRLEPTVVPAATRPASMGYSHSCNASGATYYCWGEGFGLTPVAQPAPTGSTVHYRVAGGYQTCMYVQFTGPQGEQKLIDCSGTGGVQPTIPMGVTMGQLFVAEGYACHNYASQGGMRCFGSNASGQWGTGTTGSATIATLSGYAPTAFGTSFSCSTTSCAGSNILGQLGNGLSGTSYPTPTAISGGAMSVVAVAAGGSHACGLRGGVVYCWGNNTNGQLGDGTYALRRVPTAVLSPAP